MEIKINKYSLLLMFTALMFFSCSQDDLPGNEGGENESGIFFLVSLHDDASRSNNTTVTDNLLDGFHASAICPEDDASAGNALNVYFADLPVTPLESAADRFGVFSTNPDQESERCVWPTIRHGKQGTLRFFAYYPSREVLSHSAGVETGYFGLTNKSTKNGTKVTYDYRMERFKVSNEIDRHIDFVTATAEGSRRANGENGVNLAFEHQLCRVALKAWGNTVNDIEIAGVRIGCAVTESDFNFAAKPTNLAQGDATVSGNWIAPQNKENVEYIFREGDIVVKVGKGEYHTTEASAESIMGNGGWAMVIPADYYGWNHTADAPNYRQRLYFSVLMRVKENDGNNTLVYPYVRGEQLSGDLTTDHMTVIYLSIDKATDKVTKRLYRNRDGDYFTDPLFTTPYVKPETEDIRNYGWAAIPLTALRWKPGYQYIYNLNYSGGVGVHDPGDPCPGKPIISNVLVSVTENGKTWPMVYGYEKGDDLNITDKIIIE